MEYQEVVDTIIQYANETPVNAPNEHPLQGVIERFINNSVTREQLVGWWFNQENDLVLPVSDDGRVPIVSAIKSIVFENPDYVDRGIYVYDKVNNTYLINRDVIATQVTKVLDWDNLPELMQQWCMFQAAKYYIISTIGDSGITKEMNDEAIRTLIMLKAQDLKSKNINIFNTPTIARYRMGRQPRYI